LHVELRKVKGKFIHTKGYFVDDSSHQKEVLLQEEALNLLENV
jgi:hypothetical protein